PLALVRPPVGLAPVAVEHRQLVLHEVDPSGRLRKVQPELAVLARVPAGADTDLDPTAARLVDGRDDLGEHAWMAERHRRHERGEQDPLGFAGESREYGPCVRGRLTGRPREALEVVGPEEALEPIRLRATRDRELLRVAQALLG